MRNIGYLTTRGGGYQNPRRFCVLKTSTQRCCSGYLLNGIGPALGSNPAAL
jgi:hypothetical protein